LADNFRNVTYAALIDIRNQLSDNQFVNSFSRGASPLTLGIGLAIEGYGTGHDAPWRKGRTMKVRYILTMDNLQVSGEHVDSLIVDWEDESTHDEIMHLSQKWITSRNFLTDRMNGLTEVGESSLTIEPIELKQAYDAHDVDTAP
jgi:hypothetical protein